MEANPTTKKLPRMLGEHTYKIGHTSEKRIIRTFSQWKLQRVLSVYQGFSNNEKEMLDPLLKELGGYQMMQIEIGQRVVRENNLLVAARPPN